MANGAPAGDCWRISWRCQWRSRGRSFTTMRPSSHLLTNINVIQRFTGMKFSVEAV